MYKKSIAVVISVALIFSSVIISTQAKTNISDILQSSNILDYENTRWASIVKSHIYSDGNDIKRIEISENSVHIETYDKNYNFLNSEIINGELTETDGVHIGKKYNYIVFSQQNLQEINSVEVVRVVKYSKDWKRISSANIYGSNTTKFTNAGSLRFLEFDNHLYIYSSHEMYLSNDGKHHQANMLITINTDNMKVTDTKHIVSNSSTGYISHSFNQFIAADNDTNSIITVDHGDAFPRAIVMFRYKNQLDCDKPTKPDMVRLFDIAGQTGDNTTGVSVGDLIVTDNNYIVSFNSIQQGSSSALRSPYLAIVPKNSFNNDSVKIIKLADESQNCGYPFITDIGNGKYNIMWENNGQVLFTTIDENGKILVNINSFKAYLSDCEPIVNSSELIWYATNNSSPVFYSINLNINEGKISKCYHSYNETVIDKISCESDGLIRYNCIFCEKIYNKTIAANGHNDTNYDGRCDECNCYMPTSNTNIKLSWEKDYYCITTDQTAKLNISAPKGVYITTFSSNLPCGAKWNSTYLILNFLSTPGTYYLYFVFSDGQVVHIPLTVHSSLNAETTTEKQQVTETTTEFISETTTKSNIIETTTKEQQVTETTTEFIPETTTKSNIIETTIKVDIPTQEQKFMKGDMDNNNKITASDARLILRIAAKLDIVSNEMLIRADIDNNNKVNASDARKALRISAKLETI